MNGFVLFLCLIGLSLFDSDTVAVLSQETDSTVVHLDVSEKNLNSYGQTSVYCGLYSLLAISNSLERPIDLQPLFDGDFLSDSTGSTAADLITAARNFGFFAEHLHSIDSVALLTSDCPMILQLKEIGAIEKYHWVAYLGCGTNQELSIFDSQIGLCSLTMDEIQQTWTGHCVAISLTPIKAWQIQTNTRLRMLAWLVVPASIIMLYSLFSVFSKKQGVYSTNSSLSRIGYYASPLLLVTAWTALVIACNPSRQALPDYINASSCWDTNKDEPKYIREFEDDWLIIDCRTSAAFEFSHMSNAINIPVNSSFRELAKLKGKLKDGREAVVYCQNSKCQWAAAMARHLHCVGIRSSVYAGGIDRYELEQRSIGERRGSSD